MDHWNQSFDCFSPHLAVLVAVLQAEPLGSALHCAVVTRHVQHVLGHEVQHAVPCNMAAKGHTASFHPFGL